MKAETVLKHRLGSFPGVTALVGAGEDGRVYPHVLPQDLPDSSYPAIVYKRVASRRLQGAHSDPGVAYVTLQVISLAKSADGMLALAEQVRLAMERYGKSITGTDIAGVTVYDTTLGSEASEYEDTLHVHFSTLDVTICHAE